MSVVVPTFESAEPLARCLAAIRTSTLDPIETIVVDDGSTDGTARVAEAAGAVVVRVPDGPRGPALARNLGAARATGDAIVFLDADVAVHPDAIERFADCLAAHPDVVAVFGSYDDRPAHRSTVSQYRNLLHHFVHQHGRREASTFWAGCGAIRREVFAAAGGFDTRYVRASIEDIELGARLRAQGHRIWLRPEIQATHLKQWTLAGVVRSDIRDRAIPWTRLILRQTSVPTDLNTSMGSRLSALAAWTVVVAALTAIVVPAAVWVALGALAALWALNAELYAFFRQRRGLRFAAAAVALHGLYLLYSSAVFGILAARSALSSSDRAGRGDDGRGR